MVSSKARNVDDYLCELPPPRRDVVVAMRALVNRSVPPGYVETMNWGMICWEIPLARYPHTYNQQPLSFVALAAQKNHYALYLTMHAGSEQETSLRDAYAAAGKPLDMGKSCLRFKRLDDVVQDAVAAAVAAVTVEDYIAHYEKNRGGR